MSNDNRIESAPTMAAFVPISNPVSHDFNVAPIIIVKFDGNNYLAWSQSSQWSILSRGKWGYINGSIPTPAPSDPQFSKWEAEDALIVSWLLQSVQPSIGNTYLF